MTFPRPLPVMKKPVDHRVGDWTQTFTGTQFWPMDPRPEEIHIMDIAHALSMQCRYNGHVASFYSVAEHCVLMSRAVAPQNALWALLHDATEAYVGDMVRPLKKHMPDYVAIEDRLMAVIAHKYSISPEMPAEVRAADTAIIRDERTALLSSSPAAWAVESAPLGVDIQAWSPQIACEQYLERFHELTNPTL